MPHSVFKTLFQNNIKKKLSCRRRARATLLFNKKLSYRQQIDCASAPVLYSLVTPLRQSRQMLHGWKDNSMLAKPLAACTHLSPTVSQLFEPQVQKMPFVRTAAHIFVSPGDAPGAIMLNFTWIEREFDAYKLSPCMYTSNSNRFRDIARYRSKIAKLSYPTCIYRPRWG